MSIQDRPHYEVPAAELAAWVEQQGADRWWNVDGDPLLTGLLSFPAPGDELAEAFRHIGRALLVEDKHRDPAAKGQAIGRAQLDDLVGHLGDNVQVTGRPPPWMSARVLCLSWKGSGDEWLLVEDLETTESNRADVVAEQGKD